ncbi:hypothetical protein BC829DRAFT_416449 [Chytridium lagenaria]|nr:hypothetical protein BC829DRAFT_416449 [Chytridium lagenaria]
MTDEKSDVKVQHHHTKDHGSFYNIADTLQANLAIKNRDDDEGLKPVGHLATLIRTKSITARLDHIVDTSKVSLSISHCSKKVLPVESDEVLENVRWTTGRVDRQKELDAFVGLYPMVMLALIFIAQVATSFPYMMAVNEERYTTLVFIIFGVLQYINSHLHTSLGKVVGSWYYSLSVTTAFYCWERERLWRNTFLLEKFLTARHKAGVVDIDDETKTADEEGSIPKATIEMINERMSLFG